MDYVNTRCSSVGEKFLDEGCFGEEPNFGISTSPDPCLGGEAANGCPAAEDSNCCCGCGVAERLSRRTNALTDGANDDKDDGGCQSGQDEQAATLSSPRATLSSQKHRQARART